MSVVYKLDQASGFPTITVYLSRYIFKALFIYYEEFYI